MLRRTILSLLLLGAPCAALAVASDTPPEPTALPTLADNGPASPRAFTTIAFEVDNSAFGLQATSTPGAGPVARPGRTIVTPQAESAPDRSPWQVAGMIIASLMLVVFMARRD